MIPIGLVATGWLAGWLAGDDDDDDRRNKEAHGLALADLSLDVSPFMNQHPQSVAVANSDFRSSYVMSHSQCSLESSADLVNLLRQMFWEAPAGTDPHFPLSNSNIVFLVMLMLVWKFLLPWAQTLFKRHAQLIPALVNINTNQIVKDLLGLVNFHNFIPSDNMMSIAGAAMLSSIGFGLSIFMMTIYMKDSLHPRLNQLLLLCYFLASLLHSRVDIHSSMAAIGGHTC